MNPTWGEILPTITAAISLIALVYTIKRFDSDKTSESTALMQRLVILETKMDNLATVVNKHNNVIERTYNVERDSKTMWTRIDENKVAIKDLQDEIEQLKLSIAKVGGTD